MALDAMQRLDLMDSLDELIGKSDDVTGLDKLDLLDEMETVIVKLGGDAQPTPTPTPTPTPEPTPTPPPAEDVPEVVAQFRAQAWKGMATGDFVNMLRELKDYVGGVISFNEVTLGADGWYRQMYNFKP
ncbi:hypothetical protein QMM96_22550 [Citrobacter freundii]|uniref:hypothetical protein n=1 Tax=Citrobacter freundii TaxID=546 RepID=UPI002B255474|nr:hypothetical protein [Citrobacter freundii]MEB2478214.1 hypothetical protein [Citrobacter freundii]